MPEFLTLLQQSKDKNKISDQVYENFVQLYQSYRHAISSAGMEGSSCDPIFTVFLEKSEELIEHPYPFSPFHRRITSPFDYYQFGIDFMKPLVDMQKSRILHLENLDRMERQLKANENIVLLANHQTEVDPQLISIALESTHEELATEMIFVAGDRVITDPLAVPFSMGRNLLCIFSKRHIENPPEKKFEKQQHNQRTMKLMRELFSEGRKCIYVAPSGGRDRINAEGILDVAPFDPQSIEMFRLMAVQAKQPTHFYPLALLTYDLLPPPRAVAHTLGETRQATRGGVFFSFGNEIDMEHYPGSDGLDRHTRRSDLAMHIWNLVKNDYVRLKQS